MRPTRQEQLTFLSVMNFVLRNLLVLVIPAVIVSALLVFRMARSPQMYSTVATFDAGDGDASPGRFLGLTLPAIIAGKGGQFYVDLMGSPAILDPLTDRKFQRRPGEAPVPLVQMYGGGSDLQAKQTAMAVVSNRIHSKISSTSGWIIMTVSAETPTLALDLSRAVLAQIDSFNTDTRKAQSLADRQFAYDRLTEVGADVKSAEDALIRFREQNTDVSRSPALQIEQERLTNNLATRRALYSTILQTYDREKMDAQRETKLIQLIGPPTLPLRPDKRISLRYTVVGLFVGALLGAIFALAREYFERMKREEPEEYAEFIARLRRMRRAGGKGRTSTAAQI